MRCHIYFSYSFIQKIDIDLRRENDFDWISQRLRWQNVELFQWIWFVRLSILSCDYNFKVFDKPIKQIPIPQLCGFMVLILVYCFHFFLQASFETQHQSCMQSNCDFSRVFSLVVVGGFRTRKVLIPIP